MHRRLLLRVRSCSALVATLTLLVPPLPLTAKNKKGDKLLVESRAAEAKQEWDKALTLSGQALLQDPSDPAYQLEARRVRWEASGYHITQGQQLRAKGHLAEGLAEFERGYQLDPSSDIAEQEIRRTHQMIEREKKKALDPNAKLSPEEAAMTPVEVAKRDVQDRIDSLLPVPELKPLNTQPITLRMNNQKPKVLFDTVGKLAGVNVLFDPAYEQAASKNQSIDLNGTTLEEALNYVALETKSFWKPLSGNTIFVTEDNPTKRREYEDEVVKVFYLSNVTSPQELQEVITTLRQVIEVQKVFNFSSQNAVIVRAEPGRMALVEKIISDLDKPKSEVIVDLMVMEVNSTRTRNLAAAFAPNGISSQILFTPRQSLQTLATSLGTGSTTTTTGGFTNNGSTTGTSTTGTSTSSSTSSGTSSNTTTSSAPIPLTNLRKIDGRDYSLTNVPGGLLEAIMSDLGTRVLQAPQIRSVDNQKAELHIGDKEPTATGSFSSGVGAVAVSPLVSTQFTFIDTGVNLEITPRVHQNGEVSLHLVLDISQVKSRISIGGIDQPIIGQRKATFDVRMRDGQINMIGGLMQLSDTSTVNGVPGLSSIPFLRRLFTSEQLETDKTELLITLVPHIVRGPEIDANNLKAVYAGNQTTFEVRRSPRPAVADAAAAPVPVPQNVPPMNPMATAPLPTAPLPAVPLTNNPVPATPVPAAPLVPTGRVSFAPGQLATQAGSAFTVTIQADGVTNLQSIESQLKFDPKVLKINSISSGDLLQHGGLQLQPQRNILNDSGDASATLARDPAQGGVNGAGSLLVVTFQAIGKGQTLVTMPKTVLHDSAGHAANANSAPLTVTVK